MEYPVIVEHKNGVYRAFIPALAGLSAEGASRDEAVQKARQAAEAYLSSVEVTTIKVQSATGPVAAARQPSGAVECAGSFRR